MEPIAAIATGVNPTAIGIVRISGEGVFSLCDRVFHPAAGQLLSSRRPRELIYGDVLDQDGNLLDRGLAVRFPAPQSYTGEDCVEIDCHGSPVVLRTLLSALFAAGARQARAGEFTQRAFLNGRLDLTQAEAVADLIDAPSAAAARNAAAQLDGALRRQVERVQDVLLEVTSRFYAVVDYPDEDIADVRPTELFQALQTAQKTLGDLLATCQRGKLLKSGVPAAIIGRPNTGKSSLLNALAGFERAIVTAVPGTTRDTVEQSVLCGGVLLRLTDTAGIRDTVDEVEQLGVARSRAAAKSAQLALAVVDGSQPLTDADREILTLAARCPHWILLLSKCDLPAVLTPASFGAFHPAAILSVSPLTGAGLEQLEAQVSALFPVTAPSDGGSLITDARQEDAASRAREAVCRAAQALSAGFTPDAVLTDVEEALNALGELTGRTAREDIVERIFSRFCVGK